VKRTSISLAAAALLALIPAVGLSTGAAQAASIQGTNPDVASSTWQEDAGEVAAVSLNGRELLTFRGDADTGTAAEKAEELAAKLLELLEDKKLDVNELLPARAGSLAAIQAEGSTLLSFDPVGAADPDKDPQSVSLELSWKLVNGIRTAYGAPALPASFLKLFEAGQELASDHSGQGGCFSGHASWYGGKFHGRRTSDGHRYDQEKLTAAHRSLPFGTKLLVMNRKTGASCVVEINDRGPFVEDRVIDLSRAAARQLNMLSSGVALVDCLVLGNE